MRHIQFKTGPPLPNPYIQVIERAGSNANGYLTATRCWVRDVAVLDYVEITVFLEIKGFHINYLLTRTRQNQIRPKNSCSNPNRLFQNLDARLVFFLVGDISLQHFIFINMEQSKIEDDNLQAGPVNLSTL
jgi:hypothetical protein